MVAGLPSVSIRRNPNRQLDPEEAVKEGLKKLREETTSALGFANPAEQLPSFPSTEEKNAAVADMRLTISCLKAALAAAESVQRNLKKM